MTNRGNQTSNGSSANRFVLLLIVLVVLHGAAMAQSASPPATENTLADSILAKRKKVRSRAIWEEIAYLPGRIVYFPLKCLLKGVSISVGYIDDTKIIPKMRDFLTSDDGRRGVEPTYSARTGGGVQFYQKGLFGTPSDRNMLKLALTAGLRGRQRYQCTLEDIQFAHGLVSSDVLLRYRKLTTESFFGLGPDARFKDETTFTQEQMSAEVSLGADLPSNVTIKALVGYDYTDIEDGRNRTLPSITDQYTEASLPSIEEQVDMIHVQLALTKDSKNRPGNPTRGYEVSLSGGWHQQLGDDRFGFTKYAVDMAKYLHLVYDRVLVLRMAGEITDPSENRKIPFYYLSELGRRETIRGFKRGRFRDRDMLLASVEYRYPIRKTSTNGIDFLFFADAGQVSPDLMREASMNAFQTGFGFGLRVWDEGGVVAKLEAAKSVDGWRFYFVLE